MLTASGTLIDSSHIGTYDIFRLLEFQPFMGYCEEIYCKGPTISNSGYPGGANIGGVQKIFDDC